MSAKHKELLLKGNAAIAKGDHEGFLALCTEDTRWDFLSERTLEGKQAVREWMTETYINPPVVIVDQLIAEGDLLTAMGTVITKNEKGKVTYSWYCDVWRFRDGKLAELTAFVIPKEAK